MKGGWVYIMANKRNGTLYVGVTSNIFRRVWQHQRKEFPGFTAKYGLTKLVYLQEHGDIRDAIAREKAIKGGSRRKKLALIEAENPTWKDLSEGWYEI